MIASAVCATSWVPAGGRTVYEDPDRTLADVERDEVARMERLGASRAEAARLAARGIERGVAGQHCGRMAAWRAGREEREGTEAQRHEGTVGGEAQRQAEEVTKQERNGAGRRMRRSEVELGKPSREFDIDRCCVLVLREPGIDRAATSLRLDIHRESLRWVVLGAKRRGLLEWGRAGRPRVGERAYVLTEKGRQYARKVMRKRITEKGPASPVGSGGCRPPVETGGNQLCAPGATAAEKTRGGQA